MLHILLRIAHLHRCNPMILPMMHANQALPLLAALLNLRHQPLRVRMELQRVTIQTRDLDRALHRLDVHGRAHSPHAHAVRHSAVNKVHALEVELEHGLAFEGGTRPALKREEPRQPGQRAPRNHEPARDEDSVQSVECDLAMCGELADARKRRAVVRRDGGVQKLHRREGVFLFKGKGLFDLEVRRVF